MVILHQTTPKDVPCFILVCFLSHSLIQVVKTAKKLKKEKVNVDIINFGEEVCLALNQFC